MIRYRDRQRFSREFICEVACVCVSLSNYTLMNKAFCCARVPHSSGFKTEEQTVTASLLRLTGTEQNTNVHRRQREGEIEDRVIEGVEREEEEANVREKNTGRGF